MLAPFAIVDYIRGHHALGIAVGGLTLVMVVVAWRIWRVERPYSLITLLVGMGFANIAVAVAAVELQSQGMYWGFAAAGANSFVLGPLLGLIYSFTLGISILIGASAWADTSELVRFGASFTLLAIFIYIFSLRVQQKQRELHRLSLTDPLTGLGNRRSLEIAMRRELARAERFGYTASLIAIDLDHFKRINDTLGHAAGDRFLIDFAHMLQHRVRQTDEAFRIGGEEFLVLAPATTAMGAFELAEELRDQTQSVPLAEQPGQTFSAGVSELQADDTGASWLQRADQAMYRAKQSGRNRVMVGLTPEDQKRAAAGTSG